VYAQAFPVSGRPICAEFYTYSQIIDATPPVDEYASTAGLLLQYIIERRNLPAPEIASVDLILLVQTQFSKAPRIDSLDSSLASALIAGEHMVNRRVQSAATAAAEPPEAGKRGHARRLERCVQ
jgi:hypothetical protein